MEGMVVTVEPGVYLPGKWGIRLEDMVLVKEKGGFLITGRSKELMILD
jgi:Xaa-Pro aminopeptidase